MVIGRGPSLTDQVTAHLKTQITDGAFEEGRIPPEMWETKSAQWATERDEINREIAAHDKANDSCLQEGIKLLELAQVAYRLYVSQPAKEQRRLLDTVVSNCTLIGRDLDFHFRKPFDILADVRDLAKWRGGRDSNPRPPA